jgi:hypothetical protein
LPEICNIHGAILGHKVGEQALIPGLALADVNYCLPDSRALHQNGLDLSQFNAEAAEFHLMITSSQTLDDTVGPEPAQIAGSVQVLPSAKWIGHKLFFGQLRTMEITARDAGACNANFPVDTYRDGLPL